MTDRTPTWTFRIEQLMREIDARLAELDVDGVDACSLFHRHACSIIEEAEHAWQRLAASQLCNALVTAAEHKRGVFVRRELQTVKVACEHALQAADWHAERASANQEKA